MRINTLKYHYNRDTCQYERARIRWHEIVTYVLGLFVTAALLLSGTLILHNKIVETAREKELRAENKALKEHKSILEKELAGIESTLTSLHQQDQHLYEKLFNSPLPQTIKSTSSISKEGLLLADASSFQSLLHMLSARTLSLTNSSRQSNEAFARQLGMDKNTIELIASVPSIPPLSEYQAENLISGFGKRINPFHKGMYNHPGVDFAAARGTAVVASGTGKVIEVRRSNLQAGYGNYIEIDHGHGFVTRYAHLEEIYVKQGQKVSKKTIIGTVGSSGGSIAPHIHFEVIQNGEPVDPALYMIEGLTAKEHSLMVERSKKLNQSLD